MPIKTAVQNLGEAVVKPVIDEVGKMIETGVQSVTQTQTQVDPAGEVRRKAEEERKKRNINRFLEQYQSDSIRHQQQVQSARQKKIEESQKVAEGKQVEQFEVQEKQQSMTKAQVIAKTQTERKPGQGAGG